MVIDAFRKEMENILMLGKLENEKCVPLEALEARGELFSGCKVGLKQPLKGKAVNDY